MNKFWVIVILGLLLFVGVIFFLLLKDRDDVVVTPVSDFKPTELHAAASTGDLEEVKRLVREGYGIEDMDEDGNTAVIEAVLNDHVDVVRWLLSEGARMSYTYQREETEAERKRVKKLYSISDPEVIQNMEEHLKDVPEEIRSEILSDENIAGINEGLIDLQFEKNHQNVIEHCQSLAMLKMLVENFDADINYKDASGYWPLSSFAEADDIEAVRWLLENKADPNQTSTGETAIYKAVRNDNLEMVKLFLSHDASLDVVDVDGCGPFLMCKSLKMAELLIESGANLLVRDQAGFPCWYFINDEETKDYVKAEAMKRGYQ